MKKRIGILTGGGDCPGLNPVIRAVVRRGNKSGYEIVGIKNGWKGLVENNTAILGLQAVSEILPKGGTILGTSRANPYKKEGQVIVGEPAKRQAVSNPEGTFTAFKRKWFPIRI